MNQNDKNEYFMRLFLPLKPRLERFALALSRNREEAKDIVGETILQSYEVFDSLKNEKAFLSFLFTIAWRIYKRRRKKSERIVHINIHDIENLYCQNISPDTAADICLLNEAIEKLPEKLKQAVILYEILGFSYSEISEIQNTGLSAVKMRIHRGRKELAKRLLKKQI